MKKMLASLLLFGMAFASNTTTPSTISTAIPTQLEGCLNQPLFDGVWQIKARKLERIAKIGWAITLEVRNTSRSTIMPIEAGISGVGTGIRMVSGHTRSFKVDSFDVAALTAANLSPGATVTGQLRFYNPYGTMLDISKIPTRFYLEVDPKRVEEGRKVVNFNVPNPSFEIRLDCQK